SYSARSFRPTRIFEHQDGSLSLAAMLADKKETTLAIHRLQPAAGQWQATTSEHTLAIGAHQTPSQIRFSPSGGKLALFGRQGSVWHLHTVELASDKVYSSATDLPRARIPGGGWESETSFTTLGNVDVRRIDVSGEHKLITNFPGPPSHLLPTSIRARGSVLAAGVADHLFVIDSKARIWRYLGYGATQEGYQQLSPSGNRVAWRDTRGHGYVHDRTTGRTVPLLTTAGTNSGLFFATDDRVLGFYSPQRLVVFDASSGKPIDEIGGTVNQAQAVDGYLLLPYPGLLYRITDKGFEAVAILQGYARFSTLVKTAKGTRLLVLSKKDSKARLLRIGQASTMTADELAKLPVSNPHVDFALELISTSTLIDDRGRPYRQGGKLTRLSKDPRKVVSYQLPGTLSGRLVSLSPAGKYVLGTANTDVYVFDGDSGERAWGRPNAYPAASWSQDGSKVLLAARGGLGFEIVDSKSGKTAWKMCGHSFRASPAPPQRRRSNHLRMANICAR
ncbi:MAG: hypothetical protein KJO07_20300, partial [Deltaproteobacteria bacterium]|nr:hypothetical protein [Deltaproteobacteria bacterium]